MASAPENTFSGPLTNGNGRDTRDQFVCGSIPEYLEYPGAVFGSMLRPVLGFLRSSTSLRQARAAVAAFPPQPIRLYDAPDDVADGSAPRSKLLHSIAP